MADDDKVVVLDGGMLTLMVQPPGDDGFWPIMAMWRKDTAPEVRIKVLELVAQWCDAAIAKERAAQTIAPSANRTDD